MLDFVDQKISSASDNQYLSNFMHQPFLYEPFFLHIRPAKKIFGF